MSCLSSISHSENCCSLCACSARWPRSGSRSSRPGRARRAPLSPSTGRRRRHQRPGRGSSAGHNAAAESFFATIKTELLDRQAWPTKAKAHKATFEDIEGQRAALAARQHHSGHRSRWRREHQPARQRLQKAPATQTPRSPLTVRPRGTATPAARRTRRPLPTFARQPPGTRHCADISSPDTVSTLACPSGDGRTYSCRHGVNRVDTPGNRTYRDTYSHPDRVHGVLRAAAALVTRVEFCPATAEWRPGVCCADVVGCSGSGAHRR